MVLILISTSGVNINAASLYVNGNTGNDFWNGLSPVYISGITGPVKTIQQAVNLSAVNDYIFVSPGVYRENVNIGHQLMIKGSGSGADSTANTIIQSISPGSGTGVNIVFTVNPLIPSEISDMRVTGFQIGLVLARDIFYNNIASVNNYYGFWNGPNNYLRDLQITRCNISNNLSHGIYIGHSCNVIAFIIDSCIISDNIHGIGAFCDNPASANIVDFLLKNTTFRRNLQKGIYAEKLDNCIFENLLFDSCGIDGSYSWNAGVDINLKYNNYSNITIRNSEFRYCGIGGAQNSGCALVIKARDDGAVYGLNPASLTNVKLKGLYIHHCQNGLIFGEPGKNNNGPQEADVFESRIINNQNVNFISNIRSDITAHNCCWALSNGPSISDTLKNSIGEIYVTTWMKNLSDQSVLPGFQSDSLVWFNENSSLLQEAIDVTPFGWTLYIPSKTYTENCSIGSRIRLYPENQVHIHTLHLKASSEASLIQNDLFIEDSLVMHRDAFFTTASQKLILSDTCLIFEPSEFIVQGVVETQRYFSANPITEDFGGLGLKIYTNVNVPYPQNKVMVTRKTGKTAESSAKQVWRTYDINTSTRCGWDASIDFTYDNSELFNTKNDYNLQLMRSYSNAKNWLLSGGITDTANNIISLSGIENIHALWGITDSAGLVTPPKMIIIDTVKNINCFGLQDGRIAVDVSGGFPPYQYKWSTGDTQRIIDALQPGKYFVIVTDSFGCSASDSFEIHAPQILSVLFDIKDNNCYGLADGTIKAIVTGGTYPYNLKWNDGDTGFTIQNKKSGYYVLELEDKNHCKLLDSALINQPDSFYYALLIKNVRCYGNNDGMIAIYPGGGTAPYKIHWTDGQSGDSAVNLVAGTYSFVLTDSHSCTFTDSLSVEQPEKLTVSLLSVNPKCFNEGSGMIESSVSGGIQPYNCIWMDNDTFRIKQNVRAGKYTLIVKDWNGCETKDSVILTEPPPITMSFDIIHDTNQKCVGKITAHISGGVPPFIIDWNDPQNQRGPVAVGLCEGYYHPVIIDSNMCLKDSVLHVLNIINPLVNHHSFQPLGIFPNPAYDKISISGMEENSQIRISDLSGRILKCFQINMGEDCIYVTGLISGIYLLEIKNSKQYYRDLLIIN